MQLALALDALPSYHPIMTEHLFDLKGRTAVVTGARRGLGLAMSVALAGAGCDILGVSSSLEPDGGDVGQAVRQTGRQFVSYGADFADRSAVLDLAATLVASHEVDILVNNAGIVLREPAASHTDEMWDEVLAVDLSSQFVLTREIGRSMLRRGHGKVIFTASMLSFQGGINVPGYTAAKSGIVGLTKALSNEWAGHGIQVNAIAPGYMDTDNTQALREDTDRSQAILSRIPAGRWGHPQDLAGAAVFLASAASDYVTGSVLAVDGGWLGR